MGKPIVRAIRIITPRQLVYVFQFPRVLGYQSGITTQINALVYPVILQWVLMGVTVRPIKFTQSH